MLVNQQVSFDYITSRKEKTYSAVYLSFFSYQLSKTLEEQDDDSDSIYS